ncbi:MAG TPA: hypothetical protein VIM11_20660 [Tepidisphaeraceae bacterium]|jgi:hypothetical protein
MSEGNIYFCKWERKAETYHIWVAKRPRLRAKGESLDAACEELVSVICLSTGDGEAWLELDPAYPKTPTEACYCNPELYRICGNGQFTAEWPGRRSLTRGTSEEQFRWADHFFQAPMCRSCARATAPRSDLPLRLNQVESGFDGWFGHVLPVGSTTIQIFAESFLELLTPSECRVLNFRAVEKAPSKRTLYELVGPPTIPLVAVAGLPIDGWRCKQCGQRLWGYWIDGLNIVSFIARSDLPKPLPTMFTVGEPPEAKLCVTAERWRQLAGRKGTNGIKSSRIGVVDDEDVVRVPELLRR